MPFKFNSCILWYYYQAVIYLFKVTNRNTKTKCEQGLQIDLVFPLLTLVKKIPAGYYLPRQFPAFKAPKIYKLVGVINTS